MPLEIGEIGILMRVGAGPRDQARERPGESTFTPAEAHEAREELIEECVRRVLAALRAEREP